MKLKKSIKFVEIQEKEVENKLIFEELTRLKDYIIRL